MANVANPRKQFQFQVTIAGMNPFLCQEVKLPDTEFDVAEHGETNYDIKTAGRKKVGMFTVNRIFDSSSIADPIKQWANSIQNQATGGGLLPSQYKRTIWVQEYAADGITVVKTTELDGTWPQKINGKEFNRRGSENLVQSIEFCVDIETEG